MQAQLRLAESQTLYDAINDPLFRPALEAFFVQRKEQSVELLLSAVRKSVRDTMWEARLAGKVEAYEDTLRELETFAREQIENASQ
jgi:hypothetical protein